MHVSMHRIFQKQNQAQIPWMLTGSKHQMHFSNAVRDLLATSKCLCISQTLVTSFVKTVFQNWLWVNCELHFSCSALWKTKVSPHRNTGTDDNCFTEWNLYKLGCLCVPSLILIYINQHQLNVSKVWYNTLKSKRMEPKITKFGICTLKPILCNCQAFP